MTAGPPEVGPAGQVPDRDPDPQVTEGLSWRDIALQSRTARNSPPNTDDDPEVPGRPGSTICADIDWGETRPRRRDTAQGERVDLDDPAFRNSAIRNNNLSG